MEIKLNFSMRRTVFISGLAVLMTSSCFAATYHFSTAGNNTHGAGSLESPFYSLSGDSKISLGHIQVQAGDNLLFKRGDEWKGADALWMIHATGAPGRPVTFGAYGNVADPRPIFTGARTADELSLGHWTNVPGTFIWHTTVPWTPGIAVQEEGAPEGRVLYGAFSLRGVTNANGYTADQSMVRGTQFYDEATKQLYVWRTDNLKPDAAQGRNIYIGIKILDGTDRLIKVNRGKEAGQCYVFKDLHVRMSPSYGFSTSYPKTKFINCLSELNGMEGFLFDRSRFGTPLPGAKDGLIRNCVSRRNNIRQGKGIGQGVTFEAENGWAVDSESYENAWAGFDFLDYSSKTSVNSGGLIRCKAHHNGIQPVAEAAYDPNIYIDGGSHVMIRDCQVWAAGVDPRGVKTRFRPNPGISIDVERAGFLAGKRPTGIRIVDTVSYGNRGPAIRIGQINGTQHKVRAISDVQVIRGAIDPPLREKR